MLTYERACEVFKLRDNGVLTWKTSTSNRGLVCSPVGDLNSNGYLRVGIDGKRYLVHRVIWLMAYGHFPENEIDHIDRNKLNNSLDNLREVSPQCNRRNTGNLSNCTSGVKGVSWVKDREEWVAYITIYSKRKVLGNHKDFLEAVCTRLAAEQCLNWDGCSTTSPSYKYVQEKLKCQPQV